jgi:hypothetical protein
MLCNKCGAVLPRGMEAKYCLNCQERIEVLRGWIDKILEEKQNTEVF